VRKEFKAEVLRSEQPGCDGCKSPKRPVPAFTFSFQPIVNVLTREVYAQEALVRGLNGEGADWVLEQIDADNAHAFDQACRVHAVRLAARLGLQAPLSINFLPNAVYAPEQCIRSTLLECERSGFPASQLIFEVSEAENMLDPSHLLNIFRRYRAMGFRTAIDDFGAGYAGLGLLSQFQPDLLKLDMGLIRGIENSLPKQIIVEGLVATAQRLGTTVIAEGIETARERDCLKAMGIALMQGFLFCEPAFESLGTVGASVWEQGSEGRS
jgi:EAL domain-containing protein (putative c-di-GMP-specific phosphodiesterase class I)